MNDIISKLPPLLTNDILTERMTSLPEYDRGYCKKPPQYRLLKLSDLYDIYLPSKMSTEIYTKMYLSVSRSLSKKFTRDSVRQSYQNRNFIKRREYNNIIGGTDSFIIIGNSGIGKSSAINKAISLINVNDAISLNDPFVRIIPCVVVQCPFDCSVKSMLLEILRVIDDLLGTNHYQYSLRSRSTTDVLIGAVSQVCMNHIGLLIIDEIQNVVSSKNGSTLINALTQLINNSGISICLVGIPECNTFFDQTSYLARRTIGLQYSTSKYDDFFCDFCDTIFKYQYTENQLEITDAIIEWFYEHSAGVISNVVALMHDAQEIAILNGTEIVNLKNLNAAYNERLGMLQNYIRPSIVHNSQTGTVKKAKASRPKKEIAATIKMPEDRSSISEIIQLYKKDNSVDYLSLIKNNYIVEEIEI